MRRKRPLASKVLFAGSLVLAAVATLVLRGHLTRLEARAAEAGPGIDTVVASEDLVRGTIVGPESLEVQLVPQRYVPAGAERSVEAVAGRTLVADVGAGEVVTSERLASEGGPLAALVPPGLRAVAVVVSVHPGPLSPGDRVDVIATYAGGQPHAETVLEAAEVVTTRNEGDVTGAGSTVVLLAAPEDAERLAFARSFAELSVAVVSPEEPA